MITRATNNLDCYLPFNNCNFYIFYSIKVLKYALQVAQDLFV